MLCLRPTLASCGTGRRLERTSTHGAEEAVADDQQEAVEEAVAALAPDVGVVRYYFGAVNMFDQALAESTPFFLQLEDENAALAATWATSTNTSPPRQEREPLSPAGCQGVVGRRTTGPTSPRRSLDPVRPQPPTRAVYSVEWAARSKACGGRVRSIEHV